MAGIVPELTHCVPCPGRGSFCPGNVNWPPGMYIWLFTNECIVFCIVFVSHTRLQFFSEYPAMGDHPLLLEWHSSAMICRIVWEFVEGFLEGISWLLGSGGGRKSVPIWLDLNVMSVTNEIVIIRLAANTMASVQIMGPRSLFTIKRRNNTYDVTHFT